MTGRCIHTTGSSLGEPSRGAFYGADTVFDLELRKMYPVVGLGIFETVLLALVCDETGKPNWLPIGLFEIEGTSLPDDWEFSLLDGAAASGGEASNRWVARWGYAELVHNDRHSDALIERDPAALEIFYRELEKRTTACA
jgi:hypothetical protein